MGRMPSDHQEKLISILLLVISFTRRDLKGKHHIQQFAFAHLVHACMYVF